jgi:prepilin-type N-terminal cleavage/methylation domain-containing protein
MGRLRHRGFTLIEVLVVVAIIALLIAILLPSLSAARAQARATMCKGNLHQAGTALMLYAHDSRGMIPRGGNLERYYTDGETHWTIVLLKHLAVDIRPQHAKAKLSGGGNTQAAGFALESLLWDKYKTVDVLHCPERSRVSDLDPVLDYIVNAIDPQKKDAVRKPTNLSAWKQPSRVVYLADTEHNHLSKAISDAYSARRLSYYDVEALNDLPSANSAERRVARGMHTRRFTACLFLDGHAEGVDSLPRSEEIVTPVTFHPSYQQRWGRLFGVLNP